MTRRDVDYVTIDDYATDMREQSTLGASIIAKLRRDVLDRERILVAMIASNGGKLQVHRHKLQDVDDKFLVVSEDFDTGDRTYEVRNK